MIVIQNSDQNPVTFTSVSHTQFTSWINSELTLATSGFWSQFVSAISGKLDTVENRILTIELYQANGVIYAGFVALVDLGGSTGVLVFNSDGVPESYGTLLSPFITLTPEFRVSEFVSNMEIPLSNGAGVTNNSLVIRIDTWFGNQIPFLYLLESSIPKFKGMFDVVFESKLSSTYINVINELADSAKFEVTNVTSGKIVISVPVFADLTETLTLQAGQSANVASTERSRKYLESLRKKGVVKYR